MDISNRIYHFDDNDFNCRRCNCRRDNKVDGVNGKVDGVDGVDDRGNCRRDDKVDGVYGVDGVDGVDDTNKHDDFNVNNGDSDSAVELELELGLDHRRRQLHAYPNCYGGGVVSLYFSAAVNVRCTELHNSKFSASGVWVR